MNALWTPRVSRRDFLRGVAGAGALAAWPPLAAADAGSPLRAAVIGHTGRGDYGHGLDAIFSGRTGIEIVALADPDERGRTRAGERTGAARTYADYREMLTKERPDLVSLCMRQADQHHAVCLAAMEVGAHVYCEKPFVRSPAEADEVLARATAKGRRIAVAHTMRMTPVVVHLKQMLQDGALGEVIEARAHGKQDARAGGEDLMVLGTHLFDLLRLFLGDPWSCTSRVLWQGRELVATDGREVKDNVGRVAGDEVSAQFAFAHGVNATFTSNNRLRETLGPWGIEFLCTKGVARINSDINPVGFVKQPGKWAPAGKADQWVPIAVPGKSPASHNQVPVDDWLDAIRRGREPECSGRNGAWAVEMVMGVYRSALSGRRVTFPLRERTHPLGA